MAEEDNCVDSYEMLNFSYSFNLAVLIPSKHQIAHLLVLIDVICHCFNDFIIPYYSFIIYYN